MGRMVTTDMTNKETKPVVVRFDNTVEGVVVEEGIEAHQLGDAVLSKIAEMTQESVTGPRTFYGTTEFDGLVAFATACEKVLGNKITTAIPGNMPNVCSIPTQDLIYKIGSSYHTPEDLLDPRIVSEDYLETLCGYLDIDVPRHVNNAREILVEQIRKTATIVGVQSGEKEAVRGVVRLMKDSKRFGEAHLDSDDSGDFVLMIKTTRQHEKIVKAIIREVEEEVRRNSIYKNRAIKYGEHGKLEFINDIEFDTEKRIVLSSDNSTAIRSEAANRLNKDIRPLIDKRTTSTNNYYLANGSGGTGKTVTARALGAWAIQNGWTFLTYMPESNDMNQFRRFLDFANKVGPSFLLIEDIEKLINNDPVQYSLILEQIDGVTSKSRKVEVWINTNNASIKSNHFRDTFLRRIDSFFDFDHLTDQMIQSMFSIYLPEEWELSGEIVYVSDLFRYDENRIKDEDFVPHPKMARLIEFVKDYEFLPWAIEQTAQKSIHYMIDQGKDVITEDHLIAAAKQVVLLGQLVKQSAGTPTHVPSSDDITRDIVREEVSSLSLELTK